MAACQPNSRSRVRGLLCPCVASSTISTTPLTCLSTGAKPASDAWPHRIGVKLLALDLAGFEYILCQNTQSCLITQVQPKVMHPAQQMPLRRVNRREQGYQLLVVICRVGYSFCCQMQHLSSLFHALIIKGIRRTVNPITALFAAKEASIAAG